MENNTELQSPMFRQRFITTVKNVTEDKTGQKLN